MQPPSYTASPLGSFPELSQMYASSFAAPLSNAQTSVQAQQDQVTVENAKKAQAEAESRAKAMTDPSKYTVVQRPDGGYGFYSPDGKEITAAQYAAVAGKLPSDILKDSQNPIDVRFVQDSQNLSAYFKAKSQSGYDAKQKAIAQRIEKQVHDTYHIDLATANPIQLQRLFQANYPTIYGSNQGNAPGFSGSSLFLPAPKKTGAAGAASNAQLSVPKGY